MVDTVDRPITEHNLADDSPVELNCGFVAGGLTNMPSLTTIESIMVVQSASHGSIPTLQLLPCPALRFAPPSQNTQAQRYRPTDMNVSFHSSLMLCICIANIANSARSCYSVQQLTFASKEDCIRSQEFGNARQPVYTDTGLENTEAVVRTVSGDPFGSSPA